MRSLDKKNHENYSKPPIKIPSENTPKPYLCKEREVSKETYIPYEITQKQSTDLARGQIMNVGCSIFYRQPGSR